jgi:hypothetical protein
LFSVAQGENIDGPITWTNEVSMYLPDLLPVPFPETSIFGSLPVEDADAAAFAVDRK